MLAAVADTHAVIWYLYADQRLSSAARAALETAAAAGDHIGISAISLAEIVYLAEKGRIPSETLTRLLAVLDAPNGVLLDIPFDRRIAEFLTRVDRQAVPDLPDRILAATALFLGVPLISRDTGLRTAGIATLW